MPIFFVKTSTIIAAPSDANDGYDPIGFALTTATWTFATKILAKTGGFVGYTHVAGDLIRIASTTAGTVGLYEIASKDSDDQITLGSVIDGVGIASNQTDVTSSNGPLLTLSYAMDHGGTGNPLLANSDQIRICDNLTTSGVITTAHTSIRLQGCSTRGQFKWPPYATWARPIVTSGSQVFGDIALTVWYLEFDGNNASSSLWVRAASIGGFTAIYCIMRRFTGFVIFSFYIYAHIHRCEFYNCNAPTGGNGSTALITYSKAIDCTDGFGNGDRATNFEHCVVSNLSGSTARGFACGDGYIMNCVAVGVNGASSQGVRYHSGSRVRNNIVADCGGTAYFQASGAMPLANFENNHSYNVTTGPSNVVSTDAFPTASMGSNSAINDPMFVDFLIGQGSELWQLGIGIGDEPAAGGGGVRIPNIRGGADQ